MNHRACDCAALAHTPSPTGFPRCAGVMRRYPSGAVACDCGAHVRPAARKAAS